MLFLNKINQMLVCVYHVPGAEERIADMLKKLGFQIEVNDGYIIYKWNIRTFRSPYVRHGVMYAFRH